MVSVKNLVCVITLSVLVSANPVFAQTSGASVAPALQPSAPIANNPSDASAKNYVAPDLTQKDLIGSTILPPLYGWKNIVLKDLVMPSSEIIRDCSMRKEDLVQRFGDRLRNGGVPVITAEDAKKSIIDVVTVEAQPVIVSIQDMSINCISWIQFTVTVEHTFRVPPLMYRRKVPLLLWHDGVMISSPKSTHNGALQSGFADIAERFRTAWNKQQKSVDPNNLK